MKKSMLFFFWRRSFQLAAAMNRGSTVGLWRMSPLSQNNAMENCWMASNLRRLIAILSENSFVRLRKNLEFFRFDWFFLWSENKTWILRKKKELFSCNNDFSIFIKSKKKTGNLLEKTKRQQEKACSGAPKILHLRKQAMIGDKSNQNTSKAPASFVRAQKQGNFF